MGRNPLKGKGNRLLKRIGEVKACRDCVVTGGGWEYVKRMVEGELVEVPVRCHCLRGRLLHKLDERNKG
jgi:hypothetical protein